MKNKTSIVDCHTHSSFSDDSKVKIKDAALRTKTLGLGGIAFTDHLELSQPSHKKNMIFDFAERSRQLTQLQQQFAGTIKILKGLEAGFQNHIAHEIETIIKKYDFDLVICSTHTIHWEGENCFYEGKTKYQAYTKYLEDIYNAVSTCNNFDIVGHIGYACRYAPYEDKSLKYLDHREILDEILKTVIAKDKGIEVNTAGFAYNLGVTHPDFDVISRYKELGGSIITLGSDAHNVERIGDKFDLIIEKLTAVGFTYLTYFENRKPIFVKI